MWRNAALGFLSVLGAFALLECLLAWRPELQAENPPEAYLFCEGEARLEPLDQSSFRTEVPGSIYFERKTEADGWAVHFYNDDGFRDVLDIGAENVIVLGDSFTRGTLVNNNDTYPDLLDRWHPDVAFRNLGMGGFGTFSAAVAYRRFADRLPHRLVILGYFVGNDPLDNLASERRRLAGRDQGARAGSINGSPVATVHRALRRSRSYSLVYMGSKKLLTAGHASLRLGPEETRQALDLTEVALTELANDVAAHGADLLVAIIPYWNEFVDDHALAFADRQRRMIRAWSAHLPHVHVLDLKDRMPEGDIRAVYGKVDKHFSRYGYYLTAKAIYEWLNHDWPQGPHGIRPAPDFEPEPKGIVSPDCADIPRYRELFTRPPAVASEHPHLG